MIKLCLNSQDAGVAVVISAAKALSASRSRVATWALNCGACSRWPIGSALLPLAKTPSAVRLEVDKSAGVSSRAFPFSLLTKCHRNAIILRSGL